VCAHNVVAISLQESTEEKQHHTYKRVGCSKATSYCNIQTCQYATKTLKQPRLSYLVCVCVCVCVRACVCVGVYVCVQYTHAFVSRSTRKNLSMFLNYKLSEGHTLQPHFGECTCIRELEFCKWSRILFGWASLLLFFCTRSV
jgi:hypothetical protein